MPERFEYWPVTFEEFDAVGLLSISLMVSERCTERELTDVHMFEHVFVDRIARIVEPCGGLVRACMNDALLQLEVWMLSSALTLECMRAIVATVDEPIAPDECLYTSAVLQTERELIESRGAEPGAHARFFQIRTVAEHQAGVERVRESIRGSIPRVICLSAKPSLVPQSHPPSRRPMNGCADDGTITPLSALLIRQMLAAVPALPCEVYPVEQLGRFGIRIRGQCEKIEGTSALERLAHWPGVPAALARVTQLATESTLARAQRLLAVAPYVSSTRDLVDAFAVLTDQARLRSHVGRTLGLHSLPEPVCDASDTREAQGLGEPRSSLHLDVSRTSVEVVFRAEPSSRFTRLVHAARHRTGALASIARNTVVRSQGVIPVGVVERRGTICVADLGVLHRRSLPRAERAFLVEALTDLVERDFTPDERTTQLELLDAALARLDGQLGSRAT